MKKHFILLAAFVLAFFLPMPVSARVVSSEQLVAISADEVVEDDFYIAGPQITVAGTVEGDLYVAAGAVTVSGEVLGDVLAVGGNVRITGVVGDDLRVGGGVVEVEGAEIGDSVTVLGGTVRMDEETSVGGGVNFLVGSAEIGSDLGRGLTGGAGSVTISGSVIRDLDVAAGIVSLVDNAKVGGDVYYQADGEIRIAPEATVSGEIKKFISEGVFISPEGFRRFQRVVRSGLRALRFVSFLSALLVGSIFVYVFSGAAKEVSGEIIESPWKSLLWGLLALIIFPLVLFLLFITILGIPLAFVLAAALVLGVYLAKIFVGLVLGSAILELFEGMEYNIYLSLALGLAAYYILGAIPILGFFVSMLTTFVGLGALLIYFRDRLRPAA
ncbi:MAG: hypothetical protein U9M98_03775 [Patescibacteria group bacterium]|nr:hypothetical protein [Patescibacteria group bacterium]